MDPDAHILILRFPTGFRYAGVAMAAIGGAAIAYWGVPVYTRAAPPPAKWAFALMLLAPIGLGLLLLSFQRVLVGAESIESRLLGFRRRLDTASTHVLKVRSNGYLLGDAHGRRAFINLWMIGSSELYEAIGAGGVNGNSSPSKPPT